MKKASKLISAVLCITVLLSFPICAKATVKTGSIFTRSQYTHQSQFDKCQIYEGVDLSKHNGSVDFAKMKAAGVKYVILRAGYRGYGEKGTVNKDVKFDEYITAAAKQGLNIGIYFYSQAITTAEAKYEADYTHNLIKNYKQYINLPVAFDYEFAEVSDGRFDSAWHKGTLNKTKCTNIAKAFCEEIKTLGFKPMVYANKTFLSEVLDGQALSKLYPIWLANYTTNTTYNGAFYIWQFSSTGTISGVSGNVDANFLYSGADLALPGFTIDTVPNMGYTGAAIKPTVKVKYNGIALTEGKDYTVSYSNNVNIGKAKIIITGINDYKDYPAATFTFKIVPSKAATPVLTKRKVTQLGIKWDKHNMADGYRILYSENGKWVTLGTTTNTSMTFKKLTAAKDYPIVVQAYKKVGSKKYYGIMSDKLETTTKPAKVSGIKTSKRSDKTLKLKWNMQAGADKYIVYKYNKSKKTYAVYKEVEGGTHNTLTVTDLKANKKYRFKVRAVKVNEKGATMNGTLSDVFADFTSPKAPKLNSAVSANASQITVNHSKTKKAYGYQVMYSTNSNFKKPRKKKTFIGAASLKNTVKASSGKTYYVRVRSYIKRNNKNYISPWSEAVEVQTK